MAHEHQVEGQWRQFLGAAKQRWAKLTEDDITECEGNIDTLVGKLQELYGFSDDEARRQVRAMEASIEGAAERGKKAS
jgi:uncharacterized protein YjbJ (UPF0337 family)